MLPSEDGDLETQGPGAGLESQWRRVMADNLCPISSPLVVVCISGKRS